MNSSNYWGQSSADELPPAGPPAPGLVPVDVNSLPSAGGMGPPLTPVDVNSLPSAPSVPYGQADTASYWDTGTPAPPRDLGPELTEADAARFMGTGPSSGGAPSIASLRAGSAASNASMAGAPTSSPSSPEQDAAARALAGYGGARTSGGPARHGGGPSGPSALNKANASMRGTYDEDKGAVQRGADAEMHRGDFINDGAQLLAQKKQDDQMIQRLEAAEAAKTFGDYSAETQRQVDDVRQQKINPNRAYADTGSAVAAVIGGLMGGIYQGINKLEKNPFIEQMNKVIERDIAAQESDLRTRKEGIGERKGLLAEMRATYKDENVAKLQARNLYYEGAKEELLAQAGKYDSPAIQARVDQAVTALTRAQTQLDINKALQDLANARAAAAAASAMAERNWQHSVELEKLQQGRYKLDIEAGKEGAKAGDDMAARFVGTGRDEKTGDATGYLERDAGGGKAREDSRIAGTRLISNIDKVLALRKEEGTLGRNINRDWTGGAIPRDWQTEARLIHAEMTTDWAQAKGLKALSASDYKLADEVMGSDFESRFGQSDVILSKLRERTQNALDVEAKQASGPQARKFVDPRTGRERVELVGAMNAPTNEKTEPRRPAGR